MQTMVGLGMIAVLCTGTPLYCESLENAALEAVEWWAYQEPRAQLSATLVNDIAGASADWTFTVEIGDCRRSHARPSERRIVICERVTPQAMPRVTTHEMGHIFGAIDQYPECLYGLTIMCSDLAYYWPNPVSDITRELIGWGDFKVYKTYLPIALRQEE